MKITKLINRELTEDELQSLRTIISGIRPGGEDIIEAALIRNEGIVLIDRREHADIASQIEEAKNIMADVIRNMPDFSSWVGDDGIGCVTMGGGAVMKYVYNLSEEEKESGHMELGNALDTRTLIMEACEEEEVLALAECSEEDSIITI